MSGHIVSDSSDALCFHARRFVSLLSSWFVLCLCSAGVGRTGTFIVIDAMIDMMHAEQKVDVFGCVAKIREQRSQLVQTDVSWRRVPSCLAPYTDSRYENQPSSSICNM